LASKNHQHAGGQAEEGDGQFLIDEIFLLEARAENQVSHEGAADAMRSPASRLTRVDAQRSQ
jgi:hypothetical protein